MRPRIPFTHNDRLIILELWQCQCAYCGTQLQQGDDDSDHVHPWSRGGMHALINVAAACARCNRGKGALTAAEFGHPAVGERAADIAECVAQTIDLGETTPWLRERGGLEVGVLRLSTLVRNGWILSGPTKDVPA